jgi:tetratricopeptide (TPR) repeat protein
MISGLRVGVFCIGTSIVLPSTVSALAQEQIEWCVNKDNAYSLDLRIAGCTAAIKSDPKYAATYSNRCNAYQLKGDYDRAIADCDQALSLDPKDAAAYYNRGDAYKLKRNYDRAIADYSEAIRLDPKAAVAYNNRGNVYKIKLDYDRAIADYSEAIRLDPKYAVAYNNRGDTYQVERDYDRAIADLNEAIRLDPKAAVAYYNRGHTYQAKGDYDRAIADYSEVIRLNPKAAGAYITRSNAYKLKRDYDRAIADYDEAVRLDPRLAPSHQAAAQNPDVPPDVPALGPYGSIKTYCGEGPIPEDVATIPWIGCFALSADHRARGEFSDQEVEVEVDAKGAAIFTVNGTVVTTTADPNHVRQTNLPYVHPDGSGGYGICPEIGTGSCPSHIDVFSRNANKSVLFMVSECLPPQYRVCVLTRENWDFEKSRRASNGRPASPLVPMPEGPFASWPPESREPALQTLRARCTFMSAMALAGAGQLSRDAFTDVAVALVSGCVANAMPEDWPQRPAELERAKSYEEKAKPFMPTSFNFEAVAKRIAQSAGRRAPAQSDGRK